MALSIRPLALLAVDAVGAGAGVAATTAVGVLAAAPPWLVGLGQAVVVVFFTSKAITRKLDRIEHRLREAEVDLSVLPCRRSDCPSHKVSNVDL